MTVSDPVGEQERKQDAVLCANEDHRARTAVADIHYPSGRYYDTTACRSCLRMCASDAIWDGIPILISPRLEVTANG